MFERYTESARRVIFYARYEASQYGSEYIGTEHLLLGLFRADPSLTNRCLPMAQETIRNDVESHIKIGERIPISVEVPLSTEGKQVLQSAFEESQSSGHSFVGPQHLLLGLLRVESGLAAKILTEHKVRADDVRQVLRKYAKGEPPAPVYMRPPLVVPALYAFLDQLRSGFGGHGEQFFLSRAQFIDLHGKRWTGLQALANLSELFAPFAAPDARIVEKELFQPSDNLCIATFLWQDLPIPGKETKSSVRMVITAAFGEEFGWRICSIQVTPVKDN
jgi:Clp amino terminal domain, pathogenicity island component